jgi:hypothetical protein
MTALVHTLSRPLIGAAAALALGVSALAPAAALADHDPSVVTTPATAVTDVAATLNGVVSSRRDLKVYTFQYGVTRYDHQTQITSLPPAGNGPRPVSVQVTGLSPATQYHYRLLAGDGGFFGWISGGDQTFTTAPPPTPLPAAVTPATVGPTPTTAAATPATPALGKTVVVAPVSGTVKVKAPGAAGYVDLGAGGAVPTGATVDTRSGEVALTTALPNGTTQTAQFHGGVFRVRQSANAGGTIDIDLRGPALACGSRARSSSGSARARAAAATTKRRKLWGSDKGGRYRTHGRNSVATVRGTKWVTTDTCAGTRTTVTEGSVSVRDTRRKRTVLVRAGHTYVARAR